MYAVNEGGKKTGLKIRDGCFFLFAGAFLLATGVVGGILIGIYAYHGGPSGNAIQVECQVQSSNSLNQQTTAGPQQTTQKPANNPTNPPTSCSVCTKRDPFLASIDHELFAPLTEKEMERVRSALIARGIVHTDLDSQITLKSNYIAFIDIHTPNKEDVLKYKYGNGVYPGRQATAIVYRGGASPPDIMEYVIAPLDKGDSLQVTPLSAPGENAFTAREIDYVERNAALEVLRPIEAVLLPIVRESFDNANFQSGDLHWWPYEGPPGMKETLRELKLQLYFNPGRKDGDFHLLDMLPLALIVNTTSQTPNDWNTYDYYYLNQGPFGSAQDLLQAYNRGSIRKIKLPSGYRDTVAKRYYTGRDDSKPLRANAFMPPPRTYEPKGPRYTIKGHTVGWMGWSFDVTTRMTRGPALFDVKFQNKRVSYEISLNEIALIYGSDSFERENVFYTDAIYGIGYYSGTIPGVDCPEHGHLLDTSYYDAKTGQAVTTKSICIFESDGEGPLWRRMANGYQSGLRDTCLVVRVAATIGNYDYVVEFHFKLDGKLATKVKATGQIATSFWDADNPNHGNLSTDDSPSARDPFGFRVGDFSHGIIHDHLFGFKVDLDVVDTNNSFEIIHFKSGEVADAFRQINPSITTKPKYFRYNQTRYIEYETVQIESGFRVNPMEPKYWTVVNGNHRNKWGAKRGYAIVPMATATQTMVDAHPAMNAISFTKYNCAVTKHKESERFLNSLFDAFRMYNTKGDFSTLLNGEGIVNEDIVNWVTVGFVHVPSSEDIPTTTAVETGFILKPFNFFDTTEVYDMPQVYSGNDGDVQKPPEFTPCLENK